MKLVGLDASVVCPLSCNNRGNLLSCYHEIGHYNYWNCEVFKEYLFRQTQQVTESGNTSERLCFNTSPSLNPADSIPEETIIWEVPDNSNMARKIKHHPSYSPTGLERFLNSKLGQSWNRRVTV